MNTKPLKPKPSRRSALILHRTTSSKKGHEGFDDLKDLIKNGEDFCKEVSSVLQERAELESSYSRYRGFHTQGTGGSIGLMEDDFKCHHADTVAQCSV